MDYRLKLLDSFNRARCPSIDLKFQGCDLRIFYLFAIGVN